MIGGMPISFWSQAALIDHEASFLYFFLNFLYNFGLNRFSRGSPAICGCFLFIKSRMGKIPDSLYTKMELVSFGSPKM